MRLIGCKVLYGLVFERGLQGPTADIARYYLDCHPLQDYQRLLLPLGIEICQSGLPGLATCSARRPHRSSSHSRVPLCVRFRLGSSQPGWLGPCRRVSAPRRVGKPTHDVKHGQRCNLVGHVCRLPHAPHQLLSDGRIVQVSEIHLHSSYAIKSLRPSLSLPFMGGTVDVSQGNRGKREANYAASFCRRTERAMRKQTNQ